MDSKKALVVFQGKNIRRIWFKGEWHYSLVDIVQVLTDSVNATDYLKKIRKRDVELGSYIGTNCPHVEMVGENGKKRTVLSGNTENVFRLVQSIPSKKAEHFKRWLAQVGYERVEEIQDPELAQKRMKEIYKQKGYSDEWVEKRVRGIAIRDELTDEWKERGIQKEKDFAILTAEISKATFDMTPSEYSTFKGLKKQNLRDHMDDIELILTMLGEATTTRFTKDRNSQKFPELKKDAKEGGDVAGATRKDIEKKLGTTVISSENYLDVPEKKKRIEQKKEK